MRKSTIKAQNAKWLKFNKQGRTQCIQESQIDQKNNTFSYCKIHEIFDSQIKQSGFKTGTKFSDNKFQVDTGLQKLRKYGKQITVKRLSNLYQSDQAISFFNARQGDLTFKIKNPKDVPHFVSQIDHFQPLHYKRLFLTQDFNKTGLYQLVINVQGRWQSIIIDDYIPVQKDTENPIWGMSRQEPWRLILTKAWAKHVGGYHKLLQTKPFQFIQAFTFSQWKTYNIQTDSQSFLQFYEKRFKRGKIILKTKNDKQIYDSLGLVDNSASYQVLDITNNAKDKLQLVRIRGTTTNKWTGQYSVLDQKVNSVYRSGKQLRLERDFIINADDLSQIFSNAYIYSTYEKDHFYADYHLINVPANAKSAIYLQFEIKKQGFFDFTIKQPEKNRIQPTGKSMLRIPENEKEHDQKRFLKLKYMLCRLNNNQKYAFREQHIEYNNDAKQQKSQDNWYNPKYEIYEIENFNGYNKGEAHFINIRPGQYILKIKSEACKEQSNFVLQYSSHELIKMRPKQFLKQEASIFMRQSFISILPKLTFVNLDKRLERDQKKEQISFGNKFDELGYGLIGIRSRKDNEINILLEVNPTLLNEQGFYLKHQFKNLKQPFAISVKPGQSMCLIMKHKPRGYEEIKWPPRGVQLFKQSITKR